MRRTNNSDDGSLELLLDTVCNSFGGIIFISLLLVVLLNTTSESTVDSDVPEVSTLELRESENQRETLTAKLNRLREATEGIEDSTGMLVSDELLEKAERLEQKEAERVDRVERRSQLAGDSSKAQIQIAEIDEEAKKSKQQIAEEAQRVARLETRLAKAASRRSRTARMPKLEDSKNRPWKGYLMKYGKLYGPVFVNGNRNTADFDFTTEGGTTFIDPKPRGGLRIAVDGSNIASVRRKFSNVRPSRENVLIDVWQDTYEQYDPVRVALEERGIKKALRLAEPNTRLRFTEEPVKEEVQ